jgi:small subunit ribosomal protein S19
LTISSVLLVWCLRKLACFFLKKIRVEGDKNIDAPPQCLIKCTGTVAKNLNMTRSLKKGPYVDEKLLKKIEGKKPADTGSIKTWARNSQISPEMVGFTFGVHNGRTHTDVLVTEEMVGHRLGEFSFTKKFVRHGGKMQKELEQAKRESEIQAAKAAKAA